MPSQTAQMTQEQRAWLDAHPTYAVIETLRSGINHKQCGALYTDGTFEPMHVSAAIALRDKCLAVGIK